MPMSEPREITKRFSPFQWCMIGLLTVLLGIGIWILVVFPPYETAWYPKCTFRELTGYHCPGCGTTRALHALIHGRLIQALAYNPFLVGIVFYSIWEGISTGISRWTGRPKRSMSAWLIWTIVVLMLLYGVLRNIPTEPFCYLAPHDL